jgi:hypothetical protein
MIELITGNNFIKRCNYQFDGVGINLIREPHIGEIPKYFICLDNIGVDSFFEHLKPNNEFIIVTHNSDKHIDEKFLNYLNDDLLVKWYGQNIDLVHPKLISIPIGIANEIWLHGDATKVNHYINNNLEKDNLIYCGFQTWTNPTERDYCLTQINNKGINNSPHIDFNSYLHGVSKSFFMISPKGNGVDCHRNWESIYLKTIPIITESINFTHYYNDFPFLIIKDWSELDVSVLTKDNYYKIWNNFDINKLNVDEFLKL